MKINIRESLNKIDRDTYNEYDLLNMYNSATLTNSEKVSIAKMLAENVPVKKVYNKLMEITQSQTPFKHLRESIYGVSFEGLAEDGISESFASEDFDPEIKGTAYKLFRIKNGKLYPPMVANKDNMPTPIGKWLEAEEGEFAGLSKTGRKKVKAIGGNTLAYRPGWHLAEIPLAPQFYRTNKLTGKKEFPKDFVWAECDYVMDINYQDEAMSYGNTEKGNFRHSYAGLPRIPKDGYYKYRTNPNPKTGDWIITGAIKVNRLLDDEDVAQILTAQGKETPMRQGGNKTLAELGLAETFNRKRNKEMKVIREQIQKSFRFEFTVDGIRSSQTVNAVTMQEAEQLIKKQYEGKRIVITKREEIRDNNQQTNEDYDISFDSVSTIPINNFDYDDDFGGAFYNDIISNAKEERTVKDNDTSNALIALINDEWEAISSYNSVITILSQEGKTDIVKILQDIVAEENVHVGQLQKALSLYDTNTDRIGEGEREAAEQLLDF